MDGLEEVTACGSGRPEGSGMAHATSACTLISVPFDDGSLRDQAAKKAPELMLVV
jgi:hypothetical protein